MSKNNGVATPAPEEKSADDQRARALAQSANLYLLARKLLLASLGAVAMTADEAGDFFQRLVDRGELAESDVQHILRDLRLGGAVTQRQAPDDVDHEQKLGLTKAGVSALEESVETILERLNVPTKSDVDRLTARIGELNDKIAALIEQEMPQRDSE